MFLALANYSGFLAGEYAYFSSLKNREDMNVITASLCGGAGSAITGTAFWYTKLVNPTNRLFAAAFSFTTYALYAYFFNT
mmetsp:Transcript_5083/g.4279  ORF Transcript_5083/g.4279 Transcript_5083/m.4279 type:complete len:80 (-) Transcript_5083:327-566(-)